MKSRHEIIPLTKEELKKKCDGCSGFGAIKRADTRDATAKGKQVHPKVNTDRIGNGVVSWNLDIKFCEECGSKLK